MQLKKLILPAAIGVGLWYLLKAGNLANVANKIRLQIKGVRLSGTNIICSFLVQNPTNQEVNFKALTGGLILDGSQIANVKSFTPVAIAPASETMLNITLSPTLTGIISTVSDLVSGGASFKGRLQFLGSANVNDLVFDVNQTI